MAATAGEVVHECVVGEINEVNRSPATEQGLALYMPWLFTWRLKGQTLGELVYAVALAPGEQQAINVSTWDQANELAEAASGASAVMKDVGGSVRRPPAVDARAGLNSSTKTSLATMSESVQRSSMKLRSERRPRLETVEIGAEPIRNSDLRNALSVNYYEVLVHYELEIGLKVDEVRLCGLDGDVAVPLDLAVDPRLQELFDELVTRNEELPSIRRTEEVVLPASGLHAERL